MEKTKKNSLFKILITVLLTAAVVAGVVYVSIKGKDSIGISPYTYILIACIGVSFLMSLLFIRKTAKKIFLTFALAVTVAAHYFWFFDPTGKDYQLIGVCLFLGAQFFFLLYSLSLTRAIFLKVIDLALRVGLCLVIALVLKKQLTLTTVQMLGLMYIANAVVTMLSMLIHIKTEWLTLIGFIILLLSGVFTCFVMGGVETLKLSSAFLEFLLKNYTYLVVDTFVAGNLIIAVSSAWQKNPNAIK